MAPMLIGENEIPEGLEEHARDVKKMEFDPNKKYKVVLSDRLKGTAEEDYTLTSVQVDPKLNVPHPLQSASLMPSSDSRDEVNLKLAGTSKRHARLKGTQEPTPERLVLLWDAPTQTFTLDRIDTEVRFDQQTNSQYQSQQASQPQLDSPEASDSSDDNALGSLIEEAGEPDEDNPYDWRHQLRRQPSIAHSYRASSTSPPLPRAATKSRAHRQASTPPEYSGTPTINLPDPDPVDEDEADDEDDEGALFSGGGLEIVMDGAKEEPRRGRGRVWRTRQPTGEPISLRSAANSQSPAVHVSNADNDVEQGGSNEDVEEMQLGSPMHRSEPREVPEAEDDGEDDMAADFEEALQGGAGDEPQPQESEEQEEVSLVAQPESSSESEESEEE